MAAIEHGRDLHTMIVTFVVADAAEQRELVEHLQEIAADHSQREGFVSVSILASEDGVRVAEYIQWRTRDHMMAALSTPQSQAHLNDPRLVSDAHPYRVVAVWENADAGDLSSAAGGQQ